MDLAKCLQSTLGRNHPSVLLLIEEVRSRYLDPGLPDRDPGRATRAIDPLTEALHRLDLNVSPETVLKAALVRLLPEMREDPGRNSTTATI